MRTTPKDLPLKSLSILFLTSWLCCCFITADVPSPKSIDAQVKSILVEKKKAQLTVKALDYMSVWGSLTGYYRGQELVLIEQQHNGELGFRALDLYFENDSLIFACEEVIEAQEFSEDDPKYQAYVQKHTNAEGDLDLSDWPKAVADENYYYFHVGQLIRANCKSLGKKVTLTQEAIAVKRAEILLNAQSYRAELK